MKLIQAMKQVQDLERKASDLRVKVKNHCADLNIETPLYADQKRQVAEWIQSHGDILKEIESLRIAIQRTNLATQVAIELDGKTVTKSIANWIHRRRDLAKTEEEMWRGLTDRNLKEGTLKTSQGVESDVKIRRYYDPAERDHKVDALRSEPLIIDSTLEVTNAVTDLIEA